MILLCCDAQHDRLRQGHNFEADWRFGLQRKFSESQFVMWLFETILFSSSYYTTADFLLWQRVWERRLWIFWFRVEWRLVVFWCNVLKTVSIESHADRFDVHVVRVEDQCLVGVYELEILNWSGDDIGKFFVDVLNLLRYRLFLKAENFINLGLSGTRRRMRTEEDFPPSLQSWRRDHLVVHLWMVHMIGMVLVAAFRPKSICSLWVNVDMWQMIFIIACET